MGRFTNPLIIIEDGLKWVVFRGFTYVTNNGDRIKVPKGFETDLASVPQVFQSLVPKVGYWNQPAVVHDFLYSKSRSGSKKYTRKQADQILREGIRDKEQLHGAEYSYADVIYHAVRVGAWHTWGVPKPEEPIEWDD